jgi:hypothetical protein
MKLGPFRLNLSKHGVGYSVGVPGARMTVRGDGRLTQTVGIPGTGISHRQTLSGGSARTVAARSVPYHPGRPLRAPMEAGGCLLVVAVPIALLFVTGAIASSVREGEGGLVAGLILVIGLATIVSPFVVYAWLKSKGEAAYRAAEEAYIQMILSTYGEEVARLLVIGDPWQGATQEMASVMFGPPADVSTHVYKTKTKHTWKYAPLDARRYAMRLEFENGVCVGWQIA